MGGEAELREVLELIARERRAMLERIGVAVNAGNPEAVYRRVIGELASATTRERLARAWAAVGEAHEGEVALAVDRMLLSSVTCSAGRWALRMMEEAIAAQEKLDAEVRAVTGTAHCPPAHFRFALRTVLGEVRAPSFAPETCMAFVERVARQELGLELGLVAVGSGDGGLSFVEARELFRAVGEAVGRARREKYRAAWFERWAYRREFAGDYGHLKLAERRGELLPRVVAAVMPSVMVAAVPASEGGGVREAFARLDKRFGITQWCTLSDVAGYLLRGGVIEGLREEAWCCRRLPDGGTIFAYYGAAGRLGSRDAA